MEIYESIFALIFQETKYLFNTSRLTGSIHVFDFSVSELDTQDLPSVCYSNYDEPSASSYRVGLAVPYDEI